MFKKNRCETCAQIEPNKRFSGPQDFLDCLQLFQKLLESGNFEFVSSNFELEHPKDADGYWQDDSMVYTIRCKACGCKYCCSCDTYHGLGALRRIK